MAADHDNMDATYVIVGAGVFGTSTALHLIRKYPSADVVLIDRTPFPSEVGASWDWNKVIRADYTSLLYMKLALEAKQHWRSDSLYRPFYHESGLAWVDQSDLPRTIIENYRRLNATEDARLITPDEARKLWGAIHADADYPDVDEVFVNQSSGWAEATKALTKAIETAVAEGVRYVVANVEKVLFNDLGSATGVRTQLGDVLIASHVILATGAMTAKLLADSAPLRMELQVGDRLVAAAVCEGMTTLDDKDAKRFRQGPCFVSELDAAPGGSMPPNSDNQIKVYRDESFTNTIHHEASGQDISVPPNKADFGQWELSPGMKEEVRAVFKGVFGKEAAEWEFHSYRICWDSITPTQDPIICEHPHSRHLYLATGGSFHCWKFLPIIGRYVIQMLEGNLDPELAQSWAWDRDNGGLAHEGLFPRREMRDV